MPFNVFLVFVVSLVVWSNIPIFTNCSEILVELELYWKPALPASLYDYLKFFFKHVPVDEKIVNEYYIKIYTQIFFIYVVHLNPLTWSQNYFEPDVVIFFFFKGSNFF